MLLRVILKQKDSKYRHMLINSTIFACIALVGRCIYIYETSMDGMLVAFKIENFGKCFAHLFLLIFVVRYQRLRWPKFLFAAMFTFHVIAAILVVTCQYHNLYCKSMELVDTPLGSIIVFEKGSFYPIYGLVMIGQMLMYFFVTAHIWHKHRKNRIKSKAYRLLFISSIPPMVVLALQLTQTVKNADFIPLTIVLSIVLLLLSVGKYGLFDLVQDAKEYVIDNLEQGILITDEDMNIIYKNPWVEKNLKDIDLQSYMTQENMDYAMTIPNVTVEHGDRILEVCVSKLKSSVQEMGYVVLYVDVTKMSQYASQMSELKDKAEAANRAKSAFISNLSHEIRTPMNAIIGMTEILLRDEYTAQQVEYLKNIQVSGQSLLGIINDILDHSKMESGKFDLIPSKYEPIRTFSDLGMIFYTRIGDKDIELLFEIDSNMPKVLYGDALRIRQLIINIVNNAIKYTERGIVSMVLKIAETSEDSIEFHVTVSDTGKGIKKEDIPYLFDAYQRVDESNNATIEGTGLGLSISKQLVELMDGKINVESEYGKGSKFAFTVKQSLVKEGKEKVYQIQSNGKEQRVSCYFTIPEQVTFFERLAKDFSVVYVPLDDISEDNPVDYIFTDRDDLERKLNGLKDTKCCFLYNPAKEMEQDKPYIYMPKPLCGSVFCKVLNRETSSTKDETSKTFDFCAPNAKILIVDDVDMNLKVAQGLLKPLHMQIDTANSGAKAIEMIDEKHYDLIFMDHMMPEMDGIEATHRIRQYEDEYHQNIPIIALTANAIQGVKEEFLNAGMNDFVSKPIAIKDIVEALKKWLPKELQEYS